MINIWPGAYITVITRIFSGYNARCLLKVRTICIKTYIIIALQNLSGLYMVGALN